MPERRTSDADALAAIHQALDAQEWNADTTLRIAEIMDRTGRQVRAPGDNTVSDMDRALGTMEVCITSGDTQERLLKQLDCIRLLWIAMSVDPDEVPLLPLHDSPADGPGCKRDSRGRMFYSSDWNTKGGE